MRCLKDRVSNGSFIMKLSVLDRLGGSRITNIAKNTEQEYIELCQAIQTYNFKKLKFLNKAHREVEVTDE